MAIQKGIMKEEQGNKPTYQMASKPPAWAGGGNPFSGSGAAAGSGVIEAKPFIQESDEEIRANIKTQVNNAKTSQQGFQTPTSSARLNATTRPPNPFSRITKPGAGGGNAPRSLPAWMQPSQAGPAYGGGYNPTSTNPAYQGGGGNEDTMSYEEALAAAQSIQNPNSWMGQNDPHHTMNPMIDYYPEVNGPLLPWWALPTAAPAPAPITPPPASAAPTYYGGNWRRGGGGGGGWGGGWDSGGWGGGGEKPAWWDASMGLYSMRGW